MKNEMTMPTIVINRVKGEKYRGIDYAATDLHVSGRKEIEVFNFKKKPGLFKRIFGK